MIFFNSEDLYSPVAGKNQEEEIQWAGMTQVFKQTSAEDDG